MEETCRDNQAFAEARRRIGSQGVDDILSRTGKARAQRSGSLYTAARSRCHHCTGFSSFCSVHTMLTVSLLSLKQPDKGRQPR